MCQCVNRRPIVPSLLLYILRRFAVHLAYDLTDIGVKMKLTADSWVGIVKRTLFASHELAHDSALECKLHLSVLR